jgi:hypothetical protein
VDIRVGEVPAHISISCRPIDCFHHELGRVLTADKVVDHVGVTDALFDRLGVAKIVFLRGLVDMSVDR